MRSGVLELEGRAPVLEVRGVTGARRLVEWLDVPDLITPEEYEATPFEILGLIAHHRG